MCGPVLVVELLCNAQLATHMLQLLQGVGHVHG
jgi:hypothetical protein